VPGLVEVPAEPPAGTPMSLPPPSLAALHASKPQAVNNQRLQVLQPIARCETMMFSFVFSRETASPKQQKRRGKRESFSQWA
jgi:hypothetical protein